MAQTNTRTWQLYDQLAQWGQVGEKVKTKLLKRENTKPRNGGRKMMGGKCMEKNSVRKIVGRKGQEENGGSKYVERQSRLHM